MPKRAFKVSEFRGVNTSTSPINNKEGYWRFLDGVMVSRQNKIVAMGDFDNTPTDNPTNTNFKTDSSPGYGLFAFNSNRRLDGTFADCVIYVVQKYVSGDKGENFIFWDSTGTDSWSTLSANGDLASEDSTVRLDLKSATLAGQFEPDLFAWGGILRICDSNMGNITTPGSPTFAHKSNRGWLGYVLREHFPNADPGGSADLYAGWYGYASVQPTAPTAGVVGSRLSGLTAHGSNVADAVSGNATTITVQANTFGANTAIQAELGVTADKDYLLYQDNTTNAAAEAIQWTSDTVLTIQDSGTWTGSNPAHETDWRLYPPIGAGAVLALTVANSGGFLLDSVYTFGSTFVYDGNQESSIYEMTNAYGNGDGTYTVTGGDGDKGKFTGYVHLYAPYHPRISGMRIYYQFSEDVDDKWYLAWDIDFTRGSRVNLADDTFTADTSGTPFTRDALTDGDDASGVHHTLPDLKLPGESFYSINGYSAKEDIDIRYKTSATIGNLVYVGNCYKKVDGIASHYPDRIWRCAISRYTRTPAVDVFPETYWISNPGLSDPIVKLVGLGNQLLVFGIDYLTIYTITAEGESITGTFKGYGIDKPCQVVETPHGIAFGNHSGMFIYNGQTIIDIEKGFLNWKNSNTSTRFWVNDFTPVVGYDRKDDVLHILKSSDVSGYASTPSWVYDFGSDSWTLKNYPTSGSTDKTNMITAPNTGELLISHISSSAGSHLKTWETYRIKKTSSLTSPNIGCKSPFYDFGLPGRKKRLYSITVVAQGANLDDLGLSLSFDGSHNYGYYTTPDIFSNTAYTGQTWKTHEFTVDSPIDFENVSIYFLNVGAMTTADFGISEITFIFRDKGVV